MRLIQTTRYRNGFGIKKIWQPHNKSDKKNIERNRLLNQDRIRMLREKETDKYLGILELDSIKQVHMK